jgi:hypothetical protein
MMPNLDHNPSIARVGKQQVAASADDQVWQVAFPRERQYIE